MFCLLIFLLDTLQNVKTAMTAEVRNLRHVVIRSSPADTNFGRGERFSEEV